MMAKSRRLQLRDIATVVVLGAVLVTCAKPSIDGAKLEAKIASDATAVGLKTTKVDCPKERPAKKGDTFDCTVALDTSASIVYQVEQTSDAGDYTYRLADNQLVKGDDVAAQLKTDILSGANATVDVTCPKSVLAPGGKAQFECQATLDDEKVTLAITVAPDTKLVWEIKK